MLVNDILRPEAVKVMGSVSSKKRLFHAISDLAADVYALSGETVLDALLERENLGSTAVGHGVALPHARLARVDRVCGCFIRLEKATDCDAPDRQPVDLVFALFAPENAGVDHLKALAVVSRTLRAPEVCAKLRANANATALYGILTEATASQAA
ncbi:MAG: PTS sugar transporter subunit IIA [Shimia sp.]